MSCWRLLLGLSSGLCTCGDLCPLHQDGGCLFSVTHHLTLQLMYSRRSRCGHPRHTADKHAVFDDVGSRFQNLVYHGGRAVLLVRHPFRAMLRKQHAFTQHLTGLSWT